MRLHRSVLMFLLVLAASPMLVSCGSDDDKKEDKAETHKAVKEPPPPICPQVAVVRELDTIRTMKDNSADPAQLIAGAKLVRVQGDCSYVEESGIDVNFQVDLVAKRGPNLQGYRAQFPVFVAVLDPNGNILNKIQMTAKVTFSGDEQFANDAESVHVLIPVPKTEFTNGPYYRVLSGFQLTPEQEADLQKAN